MAKVGETMQCQRCGKEIVRKNGYQRYCGEVCAKQASRDAVQRRRKQSKADKMEPGNRAGRVWELGRIADANGMSYGYLMAAIQANGGMIPAHIRTPEARRKTGGGDVKA